MCCPMEGLVNMGGIAATKIHSIGAVLVPEQHLYTILM